MKQAIREMGRANPILKGSFGQRYLHPTAWRSSYKELSSWLSVCDHPDAGRIYWLAKRRQPVRHAPKAPKPGCNGYGQAGAYGYRPRIQKNVGVRRQTSALRPRSIRRAIRRGYSHPVHWIL